MEDTPFWFQEKLYSDIALTVHVRKTVVSPYWTGFQKLAIFDTSSLGKILVLDDVIQLSEKDEAQYHEFMAHWPLYAHPNPTNVLIIGGGDGGVAREVLKHPSITSLTVVDIDPEVTLKTVKYMPGIGQGFQLNPITKLLHQDAIMYIQEKENTYDVIIIDSTDDIGAASPLFHENFLNQVHKALRSEGIMMLCVGGSLFLQSKELTQNIQKCAAVFGENSIQPIFTSTVSYLGGYFGSIAAFKNSLNREKHALIASERFKATPIKNLKWYSPDMHYSVALGAPCLKS